MIKIFLLTFVVLLQLIDLLLIFFSSFSFALAVFLLIITCIFEFGCFPRALMYWSDVFLTLGRIMYCSRDNRRKEYGASCPSSSVLHCIGILRADDACLEKNLQMRHLMSTSLLFLINLFSFFLSPAILFSVSLSLCVCNCSY